MPKIDRLNQDTGFEVITVTLSPGERMNTEVASLVCADSRIKIETVSGSSSRRSGFGAGLRKLFAGENFWTLELTNISKSRDQEVTISPNTVGDVKIVDLSEVPGNRIFVKNGAYFAHIDRKNPIKISTYAGSIGVTLFGTGFLESIEGDGIVFIASEGFCMEKTLKEGEQFIVDGRNILMYDNHMKPFVAYTGAKNLFFGHSGLFVAFDGPGTVSVNTHDIHHYVSHIARHVARQECK